jgi:uncharacterized protein (DUF1697 family)
MQKWILLLQGINVGGQKRMPMPEFQSLLMDLEFENARTYIQSGNAVFSCPETSREVLGNLIGEGIQKRFCYSTPVFLRTSEDLARVIRENLFLTNRKEDPAFLHVTFLSGFLTPENKANIIPPTGIPDELQPGIEEVFLFCPNGYGRTRLNNGFFERKLKMQVTTRNWNSVATLLKMAEEIP